MNITTEGIGHVVNIELDGDEVAIAIRQYVVSQGVKFTGPTTACVNGDLCRSGAIMVDPSGTVTIGTDDAAVPGYPLSSAYVVGVLRDALKFVDIYRKQSLGDGDLTAANVRRLIQQLGG